MGLVFDSWLLDLILLLIVGSIYFYYYVKAKWDYFKERGIPYNRPTNIIGPMLPVMMMKKTFGELNQQLYDEFPNERLTGFFQMIKPTFLVRDPLIVQNIMHKDFSYFQDHGFDIDIETNPLDANLFSLSGDTWRTMRHKLSPTFSSGKLKWMFNLMDNSADHLVSLIRDSSKDNNDLLIKDIYARFATDVIASCAFGIEADAIKNPNCQFRQMAKKIFIPTTSQLLKGTLRFMFPKIFSYFKMKTQPQDINDFFISLTKQAFEYRKRTGEKRTDFLQLLLELKEKGSIEIDTKDLDDDEKQQLLINKDNQFNINDKLVLTDELLAAQVFVFFLGGFENTATVMSHLSYLLAKHQNVQDQLRKEINSAQELNYNTVKGMKLLDNCVKESLRLFPPGQALLRKCNKNYNIGGGVEIEAGSSLIIPVECLHKDDKYWDKPNEFNPNRFNDRPPLPGTYLPFGDGPRICIAERFALMQIKIAIAKVISKFKLEPSPKLKEPIRMKPGTFQDIEGGFWIKINSIN